MRLARGLPLLGLAAMLAMQGCAAVPRVKALVEAPAPTTPDVRGAHGPLTPGQSRAVIARLKAKNHDADVLDRHLALETALDGSPLYLGNKLTLLRDGAAAFRATFAAIKAAKNSINLEYYIFKDVESDGQRLGPLLIEKRREGVIINVLYDSFGSQDTPDAFLEKLRQAGINLLNFNPLDPLEARTGWSINDRDHRRLQSRHRLYRAADDHRSAHRQTRRPNLVRYRRRNSGAGSGGAAASI